MIICMTILVISFKDGKIGEYSKAFFHAPSDTLHVHAIKPLRDTDRSPSSTTNWPNLITFPNSEKPFALSISEAKISSSNISASYVHNSPQVSTDSLVVNGFAEFYSDVVVDGSITGQLPSPFLTLYFQKNTKIIVCLFLIISRIPSPRHCDWVRPLHG